MFSESPQATDPQHLLQAKETVLTAWRELPPEHQATLLMVLLKEVLQTDMRDWTLGALALTQLSHLEPLRAVILVPLVTRAKLAELDLSEPDLASLTADDVQEIARRMEASYNDDLFWDELAFHTQAVLEQKRRWLSPPESSPLPHVPLLDEETRNRLSKLRETEHLGLNAVGQVKFFMPGGWIWYASEFDGEDIFFGLVIGFETEFGPFSLSELSGVRGRHGLGVERDTTYTPTTFAELLAKHKGEHREF
jgi:hypothetical protein